MVNVLVFTFLSSLVSLFLCRKVALKTGLVDKPNERKLHDGAIPLVGGIAIYLSLFATYFSFSAIDINGLVYLLSITTLIVVGVIDDKYDLRFEIRICVQFIISLLMIYMLNLSLSYYGAFLGGDGIVLSKVPAVILTVLAVATCINAFNMVDGIDGLLGGLSSVTFGALSLLFFIHGETRYGQICLVLIFAMLPYIFLNLGFPFGRKFKVFMGDAGSMMIGFTVIWLLLHATQQTYLYMRPVTALWIIALPLLDFFTITFRRIQQKKSPFKPDREHIHHICIRMGLSQPLALVFILAFSIMLAAIGVLGDIYMVKESWMFWGFVLVFVIYNLAIRYFSKISHEKSVLKSVYR